MKKFKGTNITYDELTEWIVQQFKKFKVTEIRYFGSRVSGSPREDSDIDVYILFDKKSPDEKPAFSKIYKHGNVNYVIEFHGFIDFHDNYIPSWLIGYDTENEINNLKNKI